MSEIASFGNLINALNTVRSDYHEQLKTVPQYEAFLSVESSTQKAFGILREPTNSASSIAADVISSLEAATAKFKEHLASVPEYRALLAIDKLINDVSIDLGVRRQPDQAPAEPEVAPSHAAAAGEPEAAAPAQMTDGVAHPEAAQAAWTPSQAAEPTYSTQAVSTHQATETQPEFLPTEQASENWVAPTHDGQWVSADPMAAPHQEPAYEASISQPAAIHENAEPAAAPAYTGQFHEPTWESRNAEAPPPSDLLASEIQHPVPVEQPALEQGSERAA